MTKDIKELHKKIDGIIAVMATKDDLKNFPTKDDLKGFATKDDLKGFATKDDISRLAIAIQKNTVDIAEIKSTMVTKTDHQKFLDRFDEFAKQFKFFDNRQVFNTGRLNELEPMILNHEKRISALESNRNG